MTKVLIVSTKDDYHAQMVVEGLKRKGAAPISYYSDAHLFKQRLTHAIPSQEKDTILLTNLENQTFSLDEIDVVWYRRASRYISLPKQIDPSDEKFVADENFVHQASLWQMLSGSARWINPLASREGANGKRLQLVLAKKVGLNIPKTLISNDRAAIVEFIHANRPIPTIYKTFTPISWTENGNVYSCYTTTITEAQLLDEQSISLTPGIYQVQLEKQHEVRITFFGDAYVAVKIHNRLAQDWRSLINTNELNISPIDLATDIELGCQKLIQELGIVFGGFDFIVTPDNQYIFLEVNEMGQFLWKERRCPELKLLDKFCDFLVVEHSPMTNTTPLRLSEIEDLVMGLH